MQPRDKNYIWYVDWRGQSLKSKNNQVPPEINRIHLISYSEIIKTPNGDEKIIYHTCCKITIPNQSNQNGYLARTGNREEALDVNLLFCEKCFI